MSVLETNGTDYAESKLLDNWAAEYAKQVLADHKERTPIDHPDGSVTTLKIGDGAVSAEKLASASVTTAKLDDQAVTTDKIDDYAVTTVKIAQSAVNNDRIANGAVDGRCIADDAVTTEKLADKAVTGGNIANNTIKAENMAPNAIKEAAIEDGAVTTEKIADYAVGQQQLAQRAVSNNHIQDDAVDERCIAPNSVGFEALKVASVGNAAIIPGCIQNRHMADDSIGTDELINGAVTGIKIATDAIIWQKIADGAVITDKIADGAVTAEKLADGTVTYDKIDDSDNKLVRYNDEVSNEGNQYLVSDCFTIAAQSDEFLFPSDFEYPTANKTSLPKIIDELYNRQVTTSMVEDKAITAAKIADGVIQSAALITYSTTPQRIGTWIDGTPVWRLAFEAEVAPGTPDTVQITFAADGDNVRVLNCKAWLTTDYNNIDATELQPYVEGSYYSTNAANGKLEIYKSSSSPENHAYGYIEYVTPESNLPE